MQFLLTEEEWANVVPREKLDDSREECVWVVDRSPQEETATNPGGQINMF